MSSVDVLTMGRGPGLVVLPGGTRRARHYRALAQALADTYTVHIIERRGRGASPPQGPDYGLDREVADTLEVLDETGAGQVFGHSYGGLVALHAALRRDLDRVIAYEPAVSIHGSIPTEWTPRYERLLADGKDATTLVFFLSRLGFVPDGAMPRAAVWLMQRVSAEGRATREVLHTVVPEFRAVRAADSDGSRYAGITAPTLLLGGGRSPAFLQEVLPLLVDTIPNAKLVMTPEMDHNAPDLGDPKGVAELIRA